MSQSSLHLSVQLKEIIEEEKKTEQWAQEVHEQVNGKEILNPDYCSSVLSTVYNEICQELEPACLDAVVRLVNSHPIHQSHDDWVAGNKYSIPGLLGSWFLAHQVWAIWFIMK